MNPPQKLGTSKIPQQSDIVIDPDGRVHVSFFWDDLRGLTKPASDIAFRFIESTNSTVYLKNAPKFTEIDSLKEEYRTCNLCSKACGFDRTEKAHPRCGDWQLRVSTSGLSLGDEAVVSGERGSGVIMLGGCPLKCPSCHNPEMVAGGTPFSQQELFTLAWDLAKRGAHNLQLLSPTVHIPILLSVLHALKETNYPIPIIFKSSGYETVEQLQRFSELIDVYLPDFKFGPCSEWGIKASARNYFEIATEAIHEMLRQTGRFSVGVDGTVSHGVLVRHVRIPLPIQESAQIETTLFGFAEKGAHISILNNFVPHD